MGDQIEIITQKQPNLSRTGLTPNHYAGQPAAGGLKIHRPGSAKQDKDKIS